jgi:hypothetical protein
MMAPKKLIQPYSKKAAFSGWQPTADLVEK